MTFCMSSVCLSRDSFVLLRRTTSKPGLRLYPLTLNFGEPAGDNTAFLVGDRVVVYGFVAPGYSSRMSDRCRRGPLPLDVSSGVSS